MRIIFRNLSDNNIEQSIPDYNLPQLTELYVILDLIF